MEKAIGKKSARTKNMEKWEDKDNAMKNIKKRMSKRTGEPNVIKETKKENKKL
jgi:hypothetical protein